MEMILTYAYINSDDVNHIVFKFYTVLQRLIINYIGFHFAVKTFFSNDSGRNLQVE